MQITIPIVSTDAVKATKLAKKVCNAMNRELRFVNDAEIRRKGSR